jgi:hypothetical protein
MNEWNIQSRSHACQGCERAFADKESYHTVLFEDRAQFRREDICHACWITKYGENARQPDEKNVISYWQGVYEAPPPKPPEAIQKESAETLLRKLIELDDPTHGPACFILAVMLERKRLLKVKEQFRREGRRVFVYEQPKTGDIFTIADPDLQLNQLEAVQKDVADLLENGLGGPVVTAPGEPVSIPVEANSSEPSPGASPPAAAGMAPDSPADANAPAAEQTQVP